MGTMQIAKTLVSWPMISGVDNSATQIQNDSEELHSQVISCLYFFVVLYPITYDVYIYHFFCRCIRYHSMIQVEVVIAAGKQIYAQVNREVNARRISQKDYIIDEAQPRNRPPSDHAISCDLIRLAVKTYLAEWPSLKAYLALRAVTSNPSSQNGKSQPTKKLWPQCYFNCLCCLICLWLVAFVSTIFAGMDKSDVVLI